VRARAPDRFKHVRGLIPNSLELNTMHDSALRQEIRTVEPARTRPDGESRTIRALLIVLSIVAGLTDTLGFLHLNGLFTAHITGNLVVLAARIGGGDAQLGKMLSVPVFIIMVDVTIMLAARFKTIDRDPLRPLLLLQLLLLICFVTLCTAADPRPDANASVAVVAGMFGVSAMAVQNALVQVSFKGAPPTAVMTTNIVRLATDLGALLFGDDPADIAAARERAARTLPVIVGFAAGCCLGAVAELALGVHSLALPAFFALLALVIAFANPPAARTHQPPAHSFEETERREPRERPE